MNNPSRASLRRFKAELFKALAHPARIHILELLRQGEMTVGQLQTQLEIDASSVSQHLAILRSHQIVHGRKAGTSVYYRVDDPQLFTILDAAREIFETRVHDLQDALDADRSAAGVR